MEEEQKDKKSDKYYTEEDLKLAFDAGHISGSNEYHNSDYATSYDDYEETLTVDEWLAKKEVKGKEVYTREQVIKLFREILFHSPIIITEVSEEMFATKIDENNFNVFINKFL